MGARSRALSLLAIGMFVGGTTAAMAADEACAEFKWNVTEERAVFSHRPHSTIAGRDAASAPSMNPQTLYELSLLPQDSVRFAVPPGKKKQLPAGAFAGLVHFRVATAGAYRVSLDQGFWVDIVSGQKLLESSDFTGAHDCSAPRKIVQYNLPAGEDLVLQLSGATKDHVRVALTPAVTATSPH
jgi:hypothetical protein